MAPLFNSRPFTLGFVTLAKIYDIGRMVFNGLYLATVIPLCTSLSSMTCVGELRLKETK